MLGILTNKQIDYILLSQVIGRIGCYLNNKVYVVPVSYVYHKGYIYARSQEGLKIQMMRENPSVCFQVDVIESMISWRSVIVWGAFEELKNEGNRLKAVEILSDRFVPLLTSESVKHSPTLPLRPEVIEKGHRAVVYRIKVLDKTGRYEKHFEEI